MNRIVHLGVGNFHRAHQAWYTHLAGGWTITGVSLRSPAVPDALNAQNGDYTLVRQDATGTDFDKITVIDKVLFAPDDSAAVVTALADPDTHIASLTITEKGYAVDEACVASVKFGGLPSSAIGYLASALAKRSAPITVLSCDNLSDNGTTLRAVLNSYCQAADLAIQTHFTCPNTMVDRITPATTDALRHEVLKATRWQDHCPVATETFSEWVIEDNFAGPRPAWDNAGAQIVADASPFELRKLRLLNGAHSALAYAGTLAGHTYVHQAIADPDLRALAQGIFAEAGATLPDGLEFEAYASALLDRFANPALNHRLRQIAMDGTMKLPIRLLATIDARDGDAPWCRKAVEAWMDFAIAETWAGSVLDDPMAAEIKLACTGQSPKADLAKLIGYKA